MSSITLGQNLGKNLNLTLKTAGTYCPEDIVVTGSTQTGSLTNAAVTGITYTEDTSSSTVLPSGGYLYINAGWHENTKISLAHLIPEIASNDAGVEHILTGYKAYDEKGNVITGTMSTITPTFTGGSVTATATGVVATAPKVTISPSITAVASSTYGMVTTAPSGTEGTNYIKIDATGTATDGTVTAKANASRGDVKYSAAAVGFVNVALGTVASGAMSATEHTNSVTVTPNVSDDFAPRYFPIVSQTFEGGGLSAGDATITGNNPTFTTVITASSGASTYGLTATAPTSGTEGTNYIKFTPIGTPGAAQTKTVQIPVTRAAVTVSNSAGVIAAQSEAAAVVAKNLNARASVSSKAEASTATPQYMPIVSVGGAGGGMTGSAVASVTAQPTVTVTTTASSNASTYGFVNTEPTSGTYVSITGSTSSTDGTVSSKAIITRAAVTYTNAAGAIAAHSGTQLLAEATENFEGTETVSPTVTTTNLKNFYVPVATIKAVPITPSVTAPTMTRAVTVTASGSQSTSGVLSAAPSSGDYLTITPSTTVTKGSSKSVASAATNGAGVVAANTKGSSVTGTTARTIDVSVTSTSAKYIRIYDGAYALS